MDKKQWIKEMVTDFLETDVNRMGEAFGNDKMWDTPLLGFANGADEIFKKYKSKEVCGIDHWTPIEVFKKVYPDSDATEEELTVISWILPQTQKTKESMKDATDYASERWSRSRVIGEVINDKVREYMVNRLQSEGYEVVSPVLHSEWTRLETPEQVFTSKWSERHIAHAAGLGTFGFCDALITPVGKAHRLGSIIIRLQLEPDKRPYTDIHEYCLYYKDKSCLACVRRCTIGALTLEGHDKLKCRTYLRGAATEYNRKYYHLDGYGCGMCQTNIPCENGIPEGIYTK